MYKRLPVDQTRQPPRPLLKPQIETKTRQIVVEHDTLTPTTTITPSSTVSLPLIIANSNVYYVATTGNDDSGDGSKNNPWATITWATDHVPGGAIILVQPGDYHGYVNLRARFDRQVTITARGSLPITPTP